MEKDTKLKNIFTKLKKVILQEKDILKGLGVASIDKQIFLYYKSPTDDGVGFDIASSENGFDFELKEKNQLIRAEKLSQISVFSDFHFFQQEGTNYFLFKRRMRNAFLWSVGKTNGEGQWNHVDDIQGIKEKGVVVPGYKHNNEYCMYAGGMSIDVVSSSDLIHWNPKSKNVLSFAEKEIVEPLHVLHTSKGILLIFSRSTGGSTDSYTVEAALFSQENPETCLWKSNKPLWTKRKEWKEKKVLPIGTIECSGKLMSYWAVEGVGLFVVVYPLTQLPPETGIYSVFLAKSHTNPILAPRGKNKWEAFTTFNPAAVYEGGKVHIVYRAQGYDYVSSIGLATSPDGIHVDSRVDEPIYSPKQPFEFVTKDNKKNPSYHFMSGGGFGGCEDPRITKLGNRMYMTYVAFDGVSPPRLAMTSISVDDFLNRRWFWEKPVLISPPGIVDKSGCLFPEKIRGKYVFMHRIFPNILIDFVDDLNFDGTKWLTGKYQIKIREKMWDSRKIGAGAPPIKTKEGWLLIYYAVDDKDAGKYKIGAMLLDLKNPVKVLHRTNRPILEPDALYENQGFKPGVAYPCGAVVIKDTLFVYYGAADSVVCVATAHLDTFLNDLKLHEAGHLEPATIQEIPYEC